MYRKNFTTLQPNLTEKKNKKFENIFKPLQNNKVQVIKLRIRRPVVTFVEQNSMLVNKVYKNIAIGISFVSILGHDISKVQNLT